MDVRLDKREQSKPETKRWGDDARGDLFGGSPYVHYTLFHVIGDAHLTPSQFQCFEDTRYGPTQAS